MKATLVTNQLQASVTIKQRQSNIWEFHLNNTIFDLTLSIRNTPTRSASTNLFHALGDLTHRWIDMKDVGKPKA